VAGMTLPGAVSYAVRSVAFFDGIALLDPVNSEGIWDRKDAQAFETHGAQGEKARAKIRAAREGTTAAVDNQVCGTRNFLGPFFQLVEILLRDGGAVENRTGHMGVLEVGAEADADDDGLLRGVRGGEFFHEVRGLNGLRAGPRLGRTGGRGFCAVKRKMREAGGKKRDGSGGGQDFHGAELDSVGHGFHSPVAVSVARLHPQI
jgi:hypothetical protein